MECLQQILGILGSLGIISASIVAFFGINSWRKEMREKKQYELAEEVLSLFYEAKDKISAIRSPLGRRGEREGREKDVNETPEQTEALDQAYVVFNRYQKHQEAFNKLNALRYRFMALFQREKVAPFDELNKIINEIFTAANLLGHYWYRIRKGHLIRNQKEFDKIMANIDKYEAIFWEGLKSPDPITPKVDKMVAGIEKICEPILRRK